jgi:hypothetical protein
MVFKGLLSNCIKFRVYHSIHNTYRMSKVFVRNAAGEERIQITFKFPPEGLDVKHRVFNFDRLKNEELDKTLTRISANISKVMNKKVKKKSTVADTDVVLPDVAVALVNNEDVQVNGIEPNEQAWIDGRCLKIEGHRLLVHVNVPTVRKLSLPDVIMVGFVTRPLIQLEFGKESDCHLVWYRKVIQSAVSGQRSEVSEDDTDSDSHSRDGQSKQKRMKQNPVNDWQEIHRGRNYVPTANDIDCILKLECLPVCGDYVGEAVSAVAKTSVVKGPAGECPFEKRHYHTRNLMGEGWLVSCV